MADKSLISELLKTPSQIRKEEQEALRQQGLQRAALVRGSGGAGRSLFGGMFRDFAAQQAADVDKRFDQVKRGLGQAAGVDMRSAAEKQAAATQQAVKGISLEDPESVKAAADKLEAAGNMSGALALRERAANRQKEIDAENQRKFEATRDYLLREKDAGRLAKMTDAQIEDMLKKRGLADRVQDFREELGRGQLGLDEERLALQTERLEFDQKIQSANLALRGEELELRRDMYGSEEDYRNAKLDLEESQNQLQRDRFDSEKAFQEAQLKQVNARTRLVNAQTKDLTETEKRQFAVEQGLREIAKDKETLTALFGDSAIVDSITSADNPEVYFERIQERLKTSSEAGDTAAIANFRKLQQLTDEGRTSEAMQFATLIGAVPEPTAAMELKQELDNEFLTNYSTETQALTQQNAALSRLKELMKQNPQASKFVFGPMAIASTEDTAGITFAGRLARVGAGMLNEEIGEMIALRNQISGGVYLDAYADLKGGGQITEYEGKKAAAAKGRISSYIDIDSEAAYEEIDTMLNQGNIALNGMNSRYKSLTGEALSSGALTYDPATGTFK